MAAETSARVFSFGAFEVDVTVGELRKHGVRLKLHAQPFELLVMLLERPAELVTREEMRQRLWGAGTHVDFDHGLNAAINKMREALGDSAARPRYIETVPGKGYRFLAQVSATRAPAALAASAPETAAPSGIAASIPPILSTPEELPAPPRRMVRALLLLIEALYLGIYLTALANLREVDDLLNQWALVPPSVSMAVLMATGCILIPVRLFLAAAVAFDYSRLPAKFARIFPALLLFDLLWSLSPFLLVHYISEGLALGMTAVLVYLPFSQRSLVLMYGRGSSDLRA